MLEQEKREQEKQQQQQQTDNSGPSGNILNEGDFDRLRADMLGTTSPSQSMLPSGAPIIRSPCTARPPSAPGTNWQQTNVSDTAKLAVQVPRQPIATQTPPER